MIQETEGSLKSYFNFFYYYFPASTRSNRFHCAIFIYPELRLAFIHPLNCQQERDEVASMEPPVGKLYLNVNAGSLVHTCDPSTWEAKERASKFKASLTSRSCMSELLLKNKNKQARNKQGQKGGLVVNSACCSCRGPEFESQHPFGVAHDIIYFQFQGIQHPPLASVGTHIYMALRDMHRDMQMYM